MMTPSRAPNFALRAPALDRIEMRSLLLIPSHLTAINEDERYSNTTGRETPAAPSAQTCHHQLPSSDERRNPWNSPGALERNSKSRQMQQLVPPPPPPPPRRIRIASIENFHPTPIFGEDFPDAPQRHYCCGCGKTKKRSQLVAIDNELEALYRTLPSPLRKKPKLAMKRGNQYTFDESSLGLLPIATHVVS